MTRLFLLCLTVCGVLGAQPRAFQPIPVERKVALVIGNARYSRGVLANPENDANALAETLSGLGFQVTKRLNVTLRDFKNEVDSFAGSLRKDDLALFYFAGHGIQVNRENYLLPVNFAAARENDVEFEAYSASRVQTALEGSPAKLRVLILDACRDNPYRFSRSTRGLSPMMGNAVGTIVAFATGENNTADDNRAGGNGLYTKYLLTALRTPGLAHDELFRRVKEEVYEASGRKQNPAVYDNVFGRFFFRSGPTPTTERSNRLDAAEEAYVVVKDSGDPELLDRFATEFADSPLARTARFKADQLRRTAMARVRQPEPAPEPVRARPRTVTHPKDGATYVWIEPGEFLMGCSAGDDMCFSDEAKPAKRTAIARGFYLKQTEVTQEEYEKLTGKNPSHFKGPNRPVEQVAWQEADGYCRALGLRLPTAAEWEYAARAGTQAARYGDLDRVAWYFGNSGGQTHDVKGKDPNAWGLYDMLGNASEWTSTDYDSARKEVRGCSWAVLSQVVRASARAGWPLARRDDVVGLRCAGDIP